MITIGERIKKARIDRGFTQIQLSVLSGVSTQTITAWETGRMCPSIITLIPVANVLNISLDELVGRTVAK